MFRKNRINIKGFTLIEVLVVLSIIAVIVAFTIPAMAPALKGSKLRQAADQLEALLAGAHQRAITENRPVEVRFFRFEDPETPGSLPMYRAVQAAQVITNPQDHTDVKFEEEEVQMIPQPFVLAEKSYSTIVESEALREDATKIPRRELAEFVAFFLMFFTGYFLSFLLAGFCNFRFSFVCWCAILPSGCRCFCVFSHRILLTFLSE